MITIINSKKQRHLFYAEEMDVLKNRSLISQEIMLL